MGKRTLRTLHFEMVARVLRPTIEAGLAIPHMDPEYSGVINDMLARLAHDFADEFEIRAESFDRIKFLRSCGLEGE